MGKRLSAELLARLWEWVGTAASKVASASQGAFLCDVSVTGDMLMLQLLA